MDWSRAKTILIFIFLALNIFLVYNLVSENSTVITIAKKDITDIQSILQRNNIDLKAQVPNKINQMAFLKVEDVAYKESDLVKSFLGDSQDIDKSDDSGVTMYKKGSASLEIYPNKKMIFNNVPNDNIKGFSQSKIQSYVENYLKTKGMPLDYAQVDSFTRKSDGYELKYKQVYHGSVIFQSYMDIKLSDQGIKSIESFWLTPAGFVDDVKDVKTPLEALLVFARDSGSKDKISVNDISLGYYLSDNIQNASASAAPAWRIKASDGFEYYYNAYEGYLEGKSQVN